MSEVKSDVVATLPRRRSRGFPVVSLEKAVERVRELWVKEKQFPMPVLTAIHHLGYKGLSGSSNTMLATLIRFGLLDEQGAREDRTVRVSDLAVEILNHPEQQGRARAIQEAAMRPDVHREMAELYPHGLPSDQNIIWKLTREKGFTDAGAAEFVTEYRQTVAYANLNESSYPEERKAAPQATKDSEQEVIDVLAGRREISVGMPSPAVVPRSASRTIDIPLPGGRSVALQGAFPLSEMDWTVMHAVLAAMKPGLVEEGSRPNESGAE